MRSKFDKSKPSLKKESPEANNDQITSEKQGK